MTEQELRALVRDAIARQAGIHASAPQSTRPAPAGPHASHVLIALPAGADGDGLCIIEPAVACTHCGYCKSLGH